MKSLLTGLFSGATKKAMVAQVIAGVLLTSVAYGGSHIAFSIAKYYAAETVTNAVYECIKIGESLEWNLEHENDEDVLSASIRIKTTETAVDQLDGE